MKFEKKITNKNPDQKFLIISFILLIGFIISIRLLTSENALPKEPTTSHTKADNLIPEGFVLVPIDLANQEQISLVIHQFGFVDLFAGKPGQTGARKIMRRVKILLPQEGASQYLALVHENEAENILRQPGPFWAVIQNPSGKSKNDKKEKSFKKLKIEYHKERS